MRKILVLRGGALGDFIVTLPALALLRKRWPEAWIELAGNATAAELGRTRGVIDAAHSQHEAKWIGLYAADPLPDSLASRLQDFDLVLNYWPDPDGELARHFPLRAGQIYLSAGAMPERAPAAAHYCEPLRRLGIEPTDYWFALRPLVSSAVSGSGRDRIAIHPGSGSAKKNWPAGRWQELICALPSSVMLVLGEAERDTWTGVPLKKNALEIAQELPLEELVARFSTCRSFIGHDSGISHLAAATGLPCTLLFGPTEPAMWAPPAPHIRVIQRGPDLDAISVADVLAAQAE